MMKEVTDLKKTIVQFERVKCTEESIRIFLQQYLDLESKISAYDERKRWITITLFSEVFRKT